MVRGSDLSHDKVVAIIILHKAGKKNKEISEIEGVSLRVVQQLVKRFLDGVGCGCTTCETKAWETY